MNASSGEDSVVFRNDNQSPSKTGYTDTAPTKTSAGTTKINGPIRHRGNLNPGAKSAWVIVLATGIATAVSSLNDRRDFLFRGLEGFFHVSVGECPRDFGL